MALSRYVLTSTLTVPAGAYTSDVVETGTRSSTPGTGAPADFHTGSWAQGAGEYGSGAGTSWYAGQVIWADPAGALFTAIGASNLRAFVEGTDTGGHWGLTCAAMRRRHRAL